MHAPSNHQLWRGLTMKKWQGLFNFEVGLIDFQRHTHSRTEIELLFSYQSVSWSFPKGTPFLDSVDCATRYIDRWGDEKGTAFEVRQALR